MKIDPDGILAYLSISITLLTAAVLWGRVRQTIHHHSMRLNQLQDSKLLTEELYNLKNRENTLRLDTLTAQMEALQCAYQHDRDELRAWQDRMNTTMGRIERALEMLVS